MSGFKQGVVGAIAMMMMSLLNAAASRGSDRTGEDGFPAFKQVPAASLTLAPIKRHDFHVLLSVMEIMENNWKVCSALGFGIFWSGMKYF